MIDRVLRPEAAGSDARQGGDADLRLALEAGRFGTWNLDLATQRLSTSARCRIDFGRDPSLAFSYEESLRAIHPDDREAMMAAVRDSIATGRDCDIDFRILTPAGGCRWIGIRAQPIRDAAGEAVAMSGVSLDITEARKLEARRLVLVELGERISQTDSPAELAFEASRLLGRNLGIGRAGFGSVDPVEETVAVEREWCAPGFSRAAGVFRFRDYGEHIDDLLRGAVVVVPDIRVDPRTARTVDALARNGVRAFVNLPILEHGRLVAVFFLSHAEPRAWPDDELDFIAEVAARTRTATARLRAEQDLRALAASLERQVEERTRERDRNWELSQDLLGVSDMEGRFLSLNPAWTRVLGWSIEDMCSMPFLHFVHPDDRARTEAEMANLVRGEKTLRFENRYLTKQGDYRWLSWMSVPDNGRVYGVARDVTEARLAAEALVLSEARLRTIFETGHLFQGLLTPEGVLLDANRIALEAIELPLADVVGKPFWETPWFTGTSGMPEMVRKAMAEVVAGTEVRQEITVNLPTGRRTFDFAMRPIRDDQGRVVAIVPEAVELTGRRQAEEALRQSRKLDAMGQLTGGVAHDFNNLLTPIIGSLDMLRRRGVGGEREQRLIHGALQSAERAKMLVQRLLAFARRQPLQSTAVDVGRMVDAIAELVASTTGPQIKVVVDAPRDLPAAMADLNQLEMALLNLAVNARDAMPEGGMLRISVDCETFERGDRADLHPGRYVRLSVADTGIGMDEATLARAIEPFFSTKGVGKGTGLGLSMVHGLALQLGGALRLSSRPGLGTNVELWLPVSDAPVEVEDAASPANPASRSIGTALLVDDEENVRMTTADMLAELGYRVIEASSAEDALRSIDQGLHVDVLVTDHLMPGMSGVDLARAVLGRGTGIAVLIVSGFAETEGIAADLPRLAKPFRQADLAATLAQVVGQRIH